MKEIKKIGFLKVGDKILGIEKGLLKLFLAPLVVVVVFLMSLGWVIIPKIGNIKDNLNKINNVNLQIKLTNEKKGYLASVDLEELNTDAEFLNNAILKEKNSYLLIGVIRKIADNFGFQIKSFSVSPGEVKSGSPESNLKISNKEVAVKMPVNVVLVGQSDKNLELIKALENSLPILFIDKFNSKTLGFTSELELVISSYYIPDKSDYISGNLTLNDLKLTETESDLLAKISQFGLVENGGVMEENTQTEFTKYDRSDPFNL
ncbi:MAG: hypothetical protein PHX34_01590 [Candidatus Shapirobacteria bacterium]|nr:hypothetical protein [Candidatus Shapirobacteria bacterium]